MEAIDQRPVFLIGTHRSGTTFLADVLSRHPALTYWPEPKYVWSLGNADYGHDRLTEVHATKLAKDKIINEIDLYLQKHNGSRLLEKTPSNCLKIRFINAVYPNAYFIHIVRDGRSVFKSTEEVVRRGLSLRIVIRRARQIPLTLWPKYGYTFLRGRFVRKANRKTLWGPKPEGWQNWLKEDNVHTVLAKQWAETTRCAIDDSAYIDAHRYCRITYDELLTKPEATIKTILQTADLERDEAVISYAVAQVNPNRLNTWQGTIPDETLTIIRPVIEPVLKLIGYRW